MHLWQKLENTLQRWLFNPAAFGNHYFKVMVNKHIKVPVCFHMSSSSVFVSPSPSSLFITIFVGFRRDSLFPQPQNAVQGMWGFVQLHLLVLQLDAKMEQINAAC